MATSFLCSIILTNRKYQNGFVSCVLATKLQICYGFRKTHAFVDLFMMQCIFYCLSNSYETCKFKKCYVQTKSIPSKCFRITKIVERHFQTPPPPPIKIKAIKSRFISTLIQPHMSRTLGNTFNADIFAYNNLQNLFARSLSPR